MSTKPKKSSKPKPVTPRPRDAAASRETLLDAAQTAFAEAGFAGARIDDIAKASGYNKSLIFQYFGDKAGLYQAVVRRLRENSDAASTLALREVAGQNTTLDRTQLETLLRASVAWSFAHLTEEPEYLKLFAWEMAEGWKAFRAIDIVEQSSEWGISVLRDAQARNVMRTDVSAEFALSQLTTLPFMALASAPRFAHLYTQFDDAATLKFLRDQTTKQVLHLVFPDKPDKPDKPKR
jgi:TetR/AcrR family transcriptional regulator